MRMAGIVGLAFCTVLGNTTSQADSITNVQTTGDGEDRQQFVSISWSSLDDLLATRGETRVTLERIRSALQTSGDNRSGAGFYMRPDHDAPDRGWTPSAEDPCEVRELVTIRGSVDRTQMGEVIAHIEPQCPVTADKLRMHVAFHVVSRNTALVSSDGTRGGLTGAGASRNRVLEVLEAQVRSVPVGNSVRSIAGQAWPNWQAMQILQSSGAYIVQPGDTLYGIAKEFTGKADLYRTIYDRNDSVAGVSSPSMIRSGTAISIPEDYLAMYLAASNPTVVRTVANGDSINSILEAEDLAGGNSELAVVAIAGLRNSSDDSTEWESGLIHLPAVIDRWNKIEIGADETAQEVSIRVFQSMHYAVLIRTICAFALAFDEGGTCWVPKFTVSVTPWWEAVGDGMAGEWRRE